MGPLPGSVPMERLTPESLDEEAEFIHCCSFCACSNNSASLTRVQEEAVRTLRFLVDEGGCPYCSSMPGDRDPDSSPCRLCPPCLSSLHELRRLKREMKEAVDKLKSLKTVIAIKEERMDPLSLEEGWEHLEIAQSFPEEDEGETEFKPEIDPLLEEQAFIGEEVDPDPDPKEVQRAKDRRTCDLCGLSLSRKSMLRHKRRVHPTLFSGLVCSTSKTFPCPSSQDAFPDEGGRSTKRKAPKDKKKKKKTPRKTCPICNKQFLTESWFKSHTHPNPNDPTYVSYQCAECPRLLPSKNSFKHHLQHAHSGESVCDLCGALFPNSKRLRYHMEEKHRTKEERAICSKCGLLLPSFLERVNHERVVHKGLPSTQCYFCGALFRDSSALQFHLYIHTLEKPFPCSKCGKEFRKPETLKDHQAIVCEEDEERRTEAKRRKTEKRLKLCAKGHLQKYVCHICGDRYRQNASLKRHCAKQHPTSL